MELSTLGLLVQTVGAGLLALIFLYISRGNANRVLRAAGIGWLFLFASLLSLLLHYQMRLPAGIFPFGMLPYQFLKILHFVALIVAADRMEHESPLARPLGKAALVAAPVSIGILLEAPGNSLFFAIHMAIGVVAWTVLTVFILRSGTRGLGRISSATLAGLTAFAHLVYVVFFGISAAHHNRAFGFLAYTGFYDLFLEMFFGIGLIIWAMEDTERKLSTLHARKVDDTQRSKRRAQIDPLTEAHNRFFLEEIRSGLLLEPAGGSIVLIDVDGLKTINDREGHEEGDKAIWTVAAAIKKLIRGDDHLIRWGGDEFLVILPGMEEEVARKRFYMLPAKIEEVRQSARMAPKAYKKFLTASVGVTPFSTRVPFDLAMESADRAMYERKKALKEMRGDPLQRDTAATEEPPQRDWDKTN